MYSCLSKLKEKMSSLLLEPKQTVLQNMWLEVTLKHLCKSSRGEHCCVQELLHFLLKWQLHWLRSSVTVLAQDMIDHRLHGKHLKHSAGTCDKGFCLPGRATSLDCSPLLEASFSLLMCAYTAYPYSHTHVMYIKVHKSSTLTLSPPLLP